MARIHSTASWVKRGKEGNTTYYVESRGRSKGKVSFVESGYTSNAEAATQILGATFEITLKSSDGTYGGSYTTTVYIPMLDRTTGDVFLYNLNDVLENEFTRPGIVPRMISDMTLTIRVVPKLLHFNGAPPKDTCFIEYQYPIGGGKFDSENLEIRLGSTATPIVSDTTVNISGIIDSTCTVCEYWTAGFAGLPYFLAELHTEKNRFGGHIGFDMYNV